MTSAPGSARSPGGGHGSPLQFTCMENPMDRGAWWAAVHSISGSDTTEATKHKRFFIEHFWFLVPCTTLSNFHVLSHLIITPFSGVAITIAHLTPLFKSLLLLLSR